MKYTIFLSLIFVLMFGCIGGTPAEQKCSDDDIDCFVNNMINGNPSYVEGNVLSYFIFPYNVKYYFTSEGCKGDNCIFEMYYKEVEFQIPEEYLEEFLEEGGSLEEIEIALEQMSVEMTKEFKKNKMYCEMNKEEAQTFAKEFKEFVKKSESGEMVEESNTIMGKKCVEKPI